MGEKNIRKKFEDLCIAVSGVGYVGVSVNDIYVIKEAVNE